MARTNPRLNGLTLGAWLSLLADNGFDVDARYLPQAARVTAMSLVNTPLALAEKLVYGRRVAAQSPESPIFVIGHWRSGTTFLHRVLCEDDALASANTWQVFHPNTFLLSEALGTKLFDFSGKRDADNVQRGWHLPMEVDWALGMLSSCATIPMFAFPRNESYERFLTLRDASAGERERWKAAAVHFIKKLTFKNPGRTIILKSPPNTARIRVLLEAFPKARFIHIHREPYTVFLSNRKLLTTMVVNWFLQAPTYDVDEKILSRYTAIHDAFFEDVSLIPKGQYHDLAYEALERDPLGQLRAIYDALALDGWSAAEPKLKAYLSRHADYKKNAHAAMPDALRQTIARRWERCFKAWGYAA